MFIFKQAYNVPFVEGMEDFILLSIVKASFRDLANPLKHDSIL
tara:strand:- start:14 stop:142 length:129 start_codon:yes stop_codon:yes gene_type:complete